MSILLLSASAHNSRLRASSSHLPLCVRLSHQSLPDQLLTNQLFTYNESDVYLQCTKMDSQHPVLNSGGLLCEIEPMPDTTEMPKNLRLDRPGT